MMNSPKAECNVGYVEGTERLCVSAESHVQCCLNKPLGEQKQNNVHNKPLFISVYIVL